MKKRLFGIALMLALAVAVICFAAPEAEAASTHTHPVCGKTCSCAGDSHYSSTWQAWDGTTKMYNGDYYLTEDIVLDSTMILNYSYSSRLCLNGHSITCEDMVFDIYSYRSLLITDCVGTGKVESTGTGYTISNNNYLSIWGGTIINSATDSNWSMAIRACPNTTTYICGGRVESVEDIAIYGEKNCKISVQGGTIHGGGDYGRCIYGDGNVTVSGGRVTNDRYYEVINLQTGNFTMTGGYIGRDVELYDENGTATVTGGTIDGYLNAYCGKTTISGGTMSLSLDGISTVNAGTFRGSCVLWGKEITVTGGDFSACTEISVCNDTWICGGSYSMLDVQNGPLYLSGVPEIELLKIWKPGLVYAQSRDGSGSFGGEPVEILLGTEVTTWKDGDIVIKNVKSDAITEKFCIVGTDSQWMYLERVNNNLVLRIIPHGTWGNATWSVWEGVLTISGTGALQYTHSGNEYPWSDYHDEIQKIVVEPGITEIPSYTFEYCEQATEIILPDTLKNLWLNAFNDCGSLNNLVLPASLTYVDGSSNTGRPAFIRCESLTDVYYLGTQDHWALVGNSSRVESHNSEMTLHFLQLQPGTATCTQAGTAPYYQFDNTSVYSGLYDLSLQPIAQPEVQPALGHRVKAEGEISVSPVQIVNNDIVPFVLSDGIYYSNNHTNSSASALKITALYDCTLELTYGVSSEANWDKLYILLNEVQQTVISGTVTDKTLTLTLSAGDVVAVRYTKDGSNSAYDDRGWVKVSCEDILIPGEVDVDPETLEPDCVNAVTCDYCEAVIKEALGHDPVFHEGKEPTAAEGGWEPYETCSRCDYTTYVELPPVPVNPDINEDGVLNNSDVVALLWHALFPSKNPISVNADFNHDGFTDNTDVVLLLWHVLFPEQNPI